MSKEAQGWGRRAEHDESALAVRHPGRAGPEVYEFGYALDGMVGRKPPQREFGPQRGFRRPGLG
ncbi:hypothetical protein OG948_39745 (plasmid) [Embleya sp. NBC_00888]|uniref:hypothetical protein n=1 Tax=Embleya sp. NBC_00888 TaxID=2975960 RepID=UPI002F91080D|nr:hypothetical protein OG948_39745 [Embleya sp. NBC_00888]